MKMTILLFLTALLYSVALYGQPSAKGNRIIWKGKIANTIEMLEIESEKDFRVRSTIIGEFQKIPLKVSYEITLDQNWQVKSVSVRTEADKNVAFNLIRKKGKWYNLSGRHYPHLNDAEYIDISLTPFTNSVPINRLKLEPGGSGEITVVYFDLLKGDVRPVKQRYTNLNHSYYKYENLETGFTSVLKVNAEGIITEYPGVWGMVYPDLFPSADSERFSSALVSLKPSEELREAKTMYDWLIGSWTVKAIDYFPDGSVVENEGEWIFNWVLEGRAIQDVWICPKRSVRYPEMDKTGNRYGTTIRMYDDDAKQWTIYWFNPVSGVFCNLVASRAGEDIVHIGKADYGLLLRWTFTEITVDSFRWLGEISDDNGKTWKRDAEFFGVKK